MDITTMAILPIAVTILKLTTSLTMKTLLISRVTYFLNENN